jgi:hypothetical protein
MGYKPKFVSGENALDHVPLIDRKWELNDPFGHVCATNIHQYGLQTGYRMLYREVQDEKTTSPLWTPIGSVSEDWKPLATQPVIDMVRAALGSCGLVDANMVPVVKCPSNNVKSTTHRVDLALNIPFELPNRTRDSGSGFAPGTISTEVYYPRVTLWNSYSGGHALQAGLTLYRRVCKNGLMAFGITGKIRNLHTEGALVQFLNKVRNMDFLAECDKLKVFIGKAQDITVSTDLMAVLIPDMSKKDIKTWDDYPDTSVNGLINFLSYKQTHEASIMSEAKYQKMINLAVRSVAA